jgi:predicted dehydrogenase
VNVTYNPDYPSRVRLAAIGCGGHAVRNIFPTFQYAPVDLVAVCDLDGGRAQAYGRLFGARATYTDYHEMLEREKPEAVVVVTNYDENWKPRYPRIAIDVMRAGAHAWIEKPPASSAAEVLEMMAVSRETGRFVGVGLKKMFFPANRKAREIVSRPEFGGVSSISARYPQFMPPPEKFGDAQAMLGFLDHIAHPHSLLLSLAGPLESLFVQRHDSGAAVVALRFTSGAVGSLHLSHGQSGYSFLEHTEIVGQGQNVVIENNVRVVHYRRGGPPGWYGVSGDYFEGGEDGAAVSWTPEFSLGQLYNKGIFLLGYAPEIIYFCECVLAGRAPEIGSLGDALEMMRIYEAYLNPPGQLVTIQR